MYLCAHTSAAGAPKVVEINIPRAINVVVVDRVTIRPNDSNDRATVSPTCTIEGAAFVAQGSVVRHEETLEISPGDDDAKSGTGRTTAPRIELEQRQIDRLAIAMPIRPPQTPRHSSTRWTSVCTHKS